MKRILIVAFSAALAVACGKKKEEAPAPAPMGSAGSATDPGSAAMGSAGAGSSAMVGSAVVAPPDQGSAGSAGAGSAAVAATGSNAVDVPTETDFEEAANKDITAKNIESQLSAIEKDLGK